MLSLFSYNCLPQDSVCPWHYTLLIIPSYQKGTGGAKQCLCMKYCVSVCFRPAYVRRMAKPSINSIDHPKKAQCMSHITVMLFASA